MRRINWWRGERVTYQERKKQSQDLELSLNRVLHVLSRQFYGSPSATPASVDLLFEEWQRELLPTFSIALSDTITALSADYISAGASAGYVSAHIGIAEPFYVYFKSGESRLIPSGEWDVGISGGDDHLTSARDPNGYYYPWICFTEDKAAPTTSAEIVNYIVSAEDNYTSEGYVQNEDSLTIKPLLYSDVPSASLSDVLGVRWINSLDIANNLAANINPSAWDRSARYERPAYSDLDNDPAKYSVHDHMVPIANLGNVAIVTGDGEAAGWAGVTEITTFASATLTGSPNYLSMHVGVDDRLLRNYDTGNDVLSYSQFLNGLVSRYPEAQYLSGGGDDIIWWTDSPEFENSGKFALLNRTNTIESEKSSLQSFRFDYITTVDVSGVYSNYFAVSASIAQNVILPHIQDEKLFVLTMLTNEVDTAQLNNTKTEWVDLSDLSVEYGTVLTPGYPIWARTSAMGRDDIPCNWYVSNITGSDNYTFYVIGHSSGYGGGLYWNGSKLQAVTQQPMDTNGGSVLMSEDYLYHITSGRYDAFDYSSVWNWTSWSASGTISTTGDYSPVMISAGSAMTGTYYDHKNTFITADSNTLTEIANEFGDSVSYLDYPIDDFANSQRTRVNDRHAIDISYYKASIIDAQASGAKQLFTLGIWDLQSLKYSQIILDLNEPIIGSESISDANIMSGAYAAAYALVDNGSLYLFMGKNDENGDPLVDVYRTPAEDFGNGKIKGWTT